MTKRAAPSGIKWRGVKIEHLKRYELVNALETMIHLYEKRSETTPTKNIT